MKLKSLFVVAALVVVAGCDNPKLETEGQSSARLETDEQKLGYVMGLNVGSQFHSEEITLDREAFSQGFSDALDGKDPQLTQEEMVAALTSFQQVMEAKKAAGAAEQQAAFEKISMANQAEGEAFLQDNATKEGVVALESGLQYRVLTEGAGDTPGATDVAQVNYRGTLIDGTEFDSSANHGGPAEFSVNQVIPGWTEALQLMNLGAKWMLYIPSQLAYGPGGTGGAIGPNQTLIFEVELLKVNPEK